MKSTRSVLIPLAALLLLPGLFACRGAGGASGQAVISETNQVFKTYPYGDPDPVPIFARSTMWGNGARLYPYSFFNKFSGVGSDQEWPVVRLENPYISVAVLPKVGGKVWGATDKTTGRDFLYTNHVMKFREIALRGSGYFVRTHPGTPYLWVDTNTSEIQLVSKDTLSLLERSLSPEPGKKAMHVEFTAEGDRALVSVWDDAGAVVIYDARSLEEVGRTATHEVGHWLNLRHIWGDTEDCSGGDYVEDTPNAGLPNYGKPAFPHISCNNGPNGDMFMNYMDYVDDDAMCMFTAQQAVRMRAALDGPRSTIGAGS